MPTNFTVFADRVYAGFLASDTVLCDSSVVFFSNQTQTAFPSTTHWDFGNGTTSTDQNPVVNYTTTGNYAATLTVDGVYCSGMHTKTIEVMLQPDVIIEPSAFRACVPGEVLFGGINLNPEAEISGWEWFVNGHVQQSDSLVNLHFDSTGWQVVTLRGYYSEGQCFSDTTFNIWGAANPVANFDYSPQRPSVGNANITFNNQSLNSSMWHWNFGDGSTAETQHPTHQYEFGGVQPVLLVAEDEFECADTIVKLVQVIPRIANVFTPNGDGQNDLFAATKYVNVESAELLIFNRWGRTVCTISDLEAGWDGTCDGRTIKSGTYFYAITYTDHMGEEQTLEGAITLVR